MNWLLVIVLLYILANMFWGYKKGIMKMVLSIISWIVIIVLGLVVTPVFSEYLAKNTQIDEQVRERSSDKVMDLLVDSVLKGTGIEKDEALNLPNAVENQLEEVGGAEGMTESALKKSGVFDEVMDKVVEITMEGIAFLILLIIEGIVYLIIKKALKTADEVPVVEEINHVAGCIAGFARGVFVVWIIFALIGMNATTEIGMKLTATIQESLFLSTIYDYNLVLAVLLHIL